MMFLLVVVVLGIGWKVWLQMILKVSGILLLGLCMVLKVVSRCWYWLWFIMLWCCDFSGLLFQVCMFFSRCWGVLQVMVMVFMFIIGVEKLVLISMLLKLCMLMKGKVCGVRLICLKVLCILCRVLGLKQENISKFFICSMCCYLVNMWLGWGCQCRVRLDQIRFSVLVVSGRWVKLVQVSFGLLVFGLELSYLLMELNRWFMVVCVLCWWLVVLVSMLQVLFRLIICVLGQCFCSIGRLVFLLYLVFNILCGVIFIRVRCFCMWVEILWCRKLDLVMCWG